MNNKWSHRALVNIWMYTSVKLVILSISLQNWKSRNPKVSAQITVKEGHTFPNRIYSGQIICSLFLLLTYFIHL